MKLFSILLICLFFIKNASAGLPPTSTKGNGESTYSTTFKFEFPNISVSRSGTTTTFNTVNVAGGGTGQTSLTSNNVILGNGASAVQFVAPGTSGNFLKSNGTTWISASATFGTNVMTAPGISSTKTCIYGFGGTSATLAAPTDCTSSPCVEVIDTCSAASPPTRSATGTYDDLIFATGTFSASTPVYCDCRAFSSATGNIRECTPSFKTSDNTWSSNASGGYVANMFTYNQGGTSVDVYVEYICTGYAP